MNSSRMPRRISAASADKRSDTDRLAADAGTCEIFLLTSTTQPSSQTTFFSSPVSRNCSSTAMALASGVASRRAKSSADTEDSASMIRTSSSNSCRACHSERMFPRVYRSFSTTRTRTAAGPAAASAITCSLR